MLGEGDITATGQRLTWSVGAQEVLNEAVSRSRYVELKKAAGAATSHRAITSGEASGLRSSFTARALPAAAKQG